MIIIKKLSIVVLLIIGLSLFISIWTYFKNDGVSDLEGYDPSKYEAVMILNYEGEKVLFFEDYYNKVYINNNNDKSTFSAIEKENTRKLDKIIWRYTKFNHGDSIIWGLINDSNIKEVTILLGENEVHANITSFNGNIIFYYNISNENMALPIRIIGKSHLNEILYHQ